MTKKDTPFNWNEECEAAFKALKEALSEPDVMGFPRNDCPFILYTDACDVSIGAVLAQVQDGRKRVIAYASRTLNRAERNHCVTDKELLAVKNFVRHFKHYLLGLKFTVRSDHQALRWLFSLREPQSRTARWIEVLSVFHFDIEYREGHRHGNADDMSRCPNPRARECAGEQNVACGPCKKCERRTEDMRGVAQVRVPTQLDSHTQQRYFRSVSHLQGWELIQQSPILNQTHGVAGN